MSRDTAQSAFALRAPSSRGDAMRLAALAADACAKTRMPRGVGWMEVKKGQGRDVGGLMKPWHFYRQERLCKLACSRINCRRATEAFFVPRDLRPKRPDERAQRGQAKSQKRIDESEQRSYFHSAPTLTHTHTHSRARSKQASGFALLLSERTSRAGPPVTSASPAKAAPAAAMTSSSSSRRSSAWE